MSWIVAKLLDLKVVWHLHLVLQDRQKWLVELLGKADCINKIISVSNTAKSVFSASSIDPKIVVLHNWVTPDFFNELRNLSRKKKFTRLKILVIGRISPEKGQLSFLNSLEGMNGRLFDISLAGEFIQDSEFEENFHKRLYSMEKSGFTVRLLGFVDDVKTVLSRHDFLILPSKVPEALPLSVIE